jgi:hypothetical protein
MPDTPDAGQAPRRRRNWRHNETRASQKMVAKRVSEDDHKALLMYAEAKGVKVTEMLEPFVNDLIRRAHEYCDQTGSVAQPARAS